MRSSLERDLARWERGELSVANLGLRHPGRAAGMVALYQRLTDIGAAAVPDPERWEHLRQRLLERPVLAAVRTVGPALVLRRLVARPLALAAALVLLGGAIGYAAAPQAVNHRLTSIWESVEDLFRDETSPDRTPGSPGDDEPGLAPSVPDDEDGDDGEAGEDDGEAGDDPEDGDDDAEGPSEDSGEGSGDGDGDGDDEAAEPSDGGGSDEGSGGDGSDEGSGSDGSSFEEEADESSLDPDDAVEPDY